MATTLATRGRMGAAPASPGRAERFTLAGAIGGIFTDPAAAMEAIARARPEGRALGLTIGLALYQAGLGLLAPGGSPAVAHSLVGALLGAVVLAPLALGVGAGLLAIAGSWLGGEDDPGRLFCTLAFARLPALLWAPLALLLARAGAPGLAGPCGLAFGLWSLALAVLAVREGLALSTGRALATLLLLGAAVVGCGAALAAMLATP